MAVTHLDLLYRTQGSFVSSQRGLLLMVFSLLCGFSSFVLCLAAEATRSEATWLVLSSEPSGSTDACYYSGSGKTPLTCAVVAFFTLAVAMFTEHAFILITMNSPRPPALVAWTAAADGHPESPPSASALAGQACVLFLATWICFAVAEVLLMVGIGVESGHLTSWSKPRPNCIAVREGLFAAAGVFGLTTVFLAAGLYLTALRAQRLQQRREEEEEISMGARRHPATSSSTNQARQEDQRVHGPNQQSSRGNQSSPAINKTSSA